MSFYVDGSPIAENVAIPEGSGSDFYDYIYMYTSTASYIYFDNFFVTERIYNNFSYVYGDADYSGDLTAADAAYVLQKALNNSFILPVAQNVPDYMDFIDVDCDGKITAADATIILQKVLTSNYVMPIET